MFGKLMNSALNIVDDAISDPIGFAVETVTQPITDTLDVLDGLTEGELRVKAAARLGTDAVSGMAISEVIDVLSDLD